MPTGLYFEFLVSKMENICLHLHIFARFRTLAENHIRTPGVREVRVGKEKKISNSY